MSGRQLHTGFPGTNTLHSEQCRAEIQRFESVHPCIYQVNIASAYVLHDILGCLKKASQTQEKIVTASFPNSQLLKNCDFSKFPQSLVDISSQDPGVHCSLKFRPKRIIFSS
ncbi:unnamed protein product [Heligmosomoides polygyrus]|uniref:Rho-GAP domain-containing protein n=1 Tax=Heligmosomoides polygyrus TaxID=6339 RepID=A0A183GF67_HELPZ|nr:unnamed protein product [Heligmosomoides polygyrus]